MSELSELSGKVVYFNLHGISEDTFKKILARVTTSVANKMFNENYTIDNIYDHVEFIDGNNTEITVQNIRKKRSIIGSGKQNE